MVIGGVFHGSRRVFDRLLLPAGCQVGGGHIQVLVERGCTAGLWSGTILYICSVLCVLLETIWENWQLLSVQGNAFATGSKTVRNVFPTLLFDFLLPPPPPPHLPPLLEKATNNWFNY